MLLLPLLLAAKALAQGTTHTITILDDEPDQRTLNTVTSTGPGDVFTTFTLKPSGVDENSQTRWVEHTGRTAKTTVTSELSIPPGTSTSTKPSGTATQSLSWVAGPHLEVVTFVDPDGKSRTVTRADLQSTHVTLSPSTKSDGTTVLVPQSSTAPDDTEIFTVTRVHTSGEDGVVGVSTASKFHTSAADGAGILTVTKFHTSQQQKAAVESAAGGAKSKSKSKSKPKPKHKPKGNFFAYLQALRVQRQRSFIFLLLAIATATLVLLVLFFCCCAWMFRKRQKKTRDRNGKEVAEVTDAAGNVVTTTAGSGGGAGGAGSGSNVVTSSGGGSGAGGSGTATQVVPVTDSSGTATTATGTEASRAGTMRRAAEEGRAPQRVRFGEQPNETVTTTTTQVDGSTEMRTGSEIFDVGSMRGRKRNRGDEPL
ncbi:hypothetical protein WHR41_04217 [Cladosporium halotolerans]|uniref:Uncharacterized protein n=1 Tax=Cladosporium halotolerans TaxID=1052096 RepID=A0AB34KPC1_9PEZI